MRVLHVLNGEHLAGPEQVVMSLARGAKIAEASTCALFNGEYARITQVPNSVLRSRGRIDLTLVPALARLLRRQRIDVVHSHTPRAHLVARFAAQQVGCVSISHVHSPTWSEGAGRLSNAARSWIDDATRRLSLRHITVSSWLADQLLNRGYRGESIDVCLNGIDIDAVNTTLEQLDRAASRRRLGLPADRLIIGMYAMFRYRKGADLLLDAFAQSRARASGALLILVGGGYQDAHGAYLDVLRTQVARLAIQDDVRFIGYVPDVWRWMAAADIGVLPSRFGEGLPVALLEQMACGLATVATRTPGIDEVLHDMEDGILVDPESSRNLREAIDRLAIDGPLRRALTAAGTFTVEEVHDRPYGPVRGGELPPSSVREGSLVAATESERGQSSGDLPTVWIHGVPIHNPDFGTTVQLLTQWGAAGSGGCSLQTSTTSSRRPETTFSETHCCEPSFGYRTAWVSCTDPGCWGPRSARR